MNKKESKIRSFEDLKVWKCARKLQSKISKLVNSFPQKEQYRLVDQIIRSSRSIARNIAEGYGRYHFQENIQFCRQARGSLSELLNDLITSYEEQYIERQQYELIREEINSCHRLLNGYISYLKKAKEDFKSKESEVIYGINTDNK